MKPLPPKHSYRNLLLSLTALGLSLGSANAATVLVNFTGSTISGTYGTGAGQFLAPEAYTGSTWNNFTAANNPSGTNLTDSDGNATAIDFTSSGWQNAGSAAPANAYMAALHGYRYNVASATVTFTGLTDGQAYDFHFIMQGAGAGVNAGSYVTMNSGAVALPTTALSSGSTNSALSTTNAYVEGANYATQSFTASGTTAVFTISEGAGQNFATLNGFQIVAVPEPSAALLGGLGLLALLRRRR